MKKWMNWLLVSAIGFLLMGIAYWGYQRQTPLGPWGDSFMVIGKGAPEAVPHGPTYQKIRLRLLPLTRRAEPFLLLARSFGPNVEKSYRVALQGKLFLYPNLERAFTNSMLQWGRLPRPGSNEVLAGGQVIAQQQLVVKDKTFSVVGRLKKGVFPFMNGYLANDDPALAGLFDLKDESVQDAYIISPSSEARNDLDPRKRLTASFPENRFTAYVPLLRSEPRPFLAYLAGLCLLLLGGGVILFQVYCFLADRLKTNWLQRPLAEIRSSKYLFLTLHVIFFGTVILFMLFAYQLPELQLGLNMGIRSVVLSGKGALGLAGKAYLSRNMPLAAVVTFGVNFLVGALLQLTLPSMIVPGSGIFLGWFRSLMWGLLLAPSDATLSKMMLTHGFTLFLEGEGYILSLFFGLMIPIYLFRKNEGARLIERYGKALRLNLGGAILVAIVLMIAAIYEAVEVILMMNLHDRI